MSGSFARALRPVGPLIEAFADVVEPVATALTPGSRWIAVETAADDLVIYRVTRRGAVRLGPIDGLPESARRAFRSKRRLDAELRLSPDRLVAAQLKVPAEAAGFTAQIVESRLDRLTPWKPENLFYGFAVAPKPGPDGQVTVDVVATSRAIVAGAIARLTAIGVVPSRVGSAGQPIGERLRIDLLKGENDTARKSRRGRIAAAALLVLGLSLAALVATTIAASISAQQLNDADAALTATRRKLIGASGNDAERQRDLVRLDAKTPATAKFKLIDRIATILPDTTFLDELEIAPGSLRLAGSSTEAPSLIAILEAEPDLSEARFAAPVTRQEDGRDRFDLSVVRDGPAVGEGAPAP